MSNGFWNSHLQNASSKVGSVLLVVGTFLLISYLRTAVGCIVLQFPQLLTKPV